MFGSLQNWPFFFFSSPSQGCWAHRWLFLAQSCPEGHSDLYIGKGNTPATLCPRQLLPSFPSGFLPAHITFPFLSFPMREGAEGFGAEKNLGNLCVPTSRRAGYDGPSWRAESGASLTEVRLQNAHPKKPSPGAGKTSVNSPRQSSVPAELPPSSWLRAKLHESLPSGLLALSGGSFIATACAQRHLSVCCRPLAAIITAEQCPAAS